MVSAKIANQASLAELVRLEDPEFYLDPHPVYDRMRREEPVYYYAPLDIFVLTRYADMREAARRPDLFSSAHGVVLSQLQYQRDDATEIMDQFIDPEGEIFAFTDPPRHRELRKVLMPAFSPRAVTAMSAQMGEACRLLVESISPGAVTDVVERIAARLPILVAARLLGVPGEHAADIKRWSDARELLTSGVGSRAQLRRAATVFSEMNGFLLGQFDAKRASPGDDLMSVLLGEELDGAPLSEPRLLTYCHQVLSVGNDTTRSLLASFAIALARHPDQLDLLAADRALMRGDRRGAALEYAGARVRADGHPRHRDSGPPDPGRAAHLPALRGGEFRPRGLRAGTALQHPPRHRSATYGLRLRAARVHRRAARAAGDRAALRRAAGPVSEVRTGRAARTHPARAAQRMA
jgi:cytochrome P450